MRLILFFLLINISYASGFLPETEIDRINTLSEKKKIHAALLALKGKNQIFKKQILASADYLPESYHYALTLEALLKNIPSELDLMPNCQQLHGQILNSFKTDWNDMPKPTHHIWPAFNKLCLSK